MKIAFIHLTKGAVNRGSEISTDYLATFLAKKNKVVFFQGGKKLKKRGFDQVQIRLPFAINAHKPKNNLLAKVLARLYLDLNSLKILFFSFKVLPYLLKEKFDILVPVNGFWQLLLCKLVRLVKGTKIVVSGRAGIGFHDRDNLRLRPDVFIALTSYGQKWAQKISSQIKVVNIANGVDCQFFNPNKQKLIKKKLPIVLTVAALTSYKRVDLVIKAVAQMKKKCFLIIAGQGELKPDLKKLAEKLLGDRFMIKNFSSSLMPQVYTSCQVFTLASRGQDAFPRVLLEALACGCNIVVSDDPIKKEVIGRAGIFVNPEETSFYAQALEESLTIVKNNQARKQAKKFAIKKIGQKHERLFKNLLKEA